jgi:hypothetical protein
VLELSGGVARGRVTCPFNELIDICEWGLRASGGVEGVGLLVKELIDRCEGVVGRPCVGVRVTAGQSGGGRVNGGDWKQGGVGGGAG